MIVLILLVLLLITHYSLPQKIWTLFFDEIDISSIGKCKDQKGPTYMEVRSQLPDPCSVKTAFRIVDPCYALPNENAWVLTCSPVPCPLVCTNGTQADNTVDAAVDRLLIWYNTDKDNKNCFSFLCPIWVLPWVKVSPCGYAVHPAIYRSRVEGSQVKCVAVTSHWVKCESHDNGGLWALSLAIRPGIWEYKHVLYCNPRSVGVILSCP